MGAYTKTGSNMKYYVMKAKDGDDNTPFFGRKEKTASGAWEVTERHNAFSGTPTGLQLGQYEYKQTPTSKPRMIDTLALFMNDENGASKIEMSFSNGLTRNLLNCLAEAGEKLKGGTLNMQLYINKNGYASIYCELNGQKMNWMFAPDAFPQPKKVQVGNVEGIDSSETDAFFKNVIEKHIAPYLPPPTNETVAESQDEPVAETAPTDDLPF